MANLKVNLVATGAPTINNDTSEGYGVGSRWVDVTGDKEYVCLDDTDGAAVWIETTNQGEFTTASNVGVGGVGLYKQKTGGDLEFRSVNAAATNRVSVTLDAGNNEIDLDVVPGNIAHGDLADVGSNTHAQIDTHLGSSANPHSVTKSQVGLGEVANLKVNLVATTAPTVNNDTSEGYSVGSRWVDMTGDKEYVCLDDTDGAAVWTETTNQGEFTTASNVGVGGVGLYKQKTGADLEFRSVNAGSSKLSVTLDAGNNEIDLDVVPGNIAHGDLADVGSNTHAQIDTHLASTSNPHSVTKSQVGLGEVANLKVNLVATAAPTVNNDTSEGYSVGSRWVDVTGDKEYVCLDDTDGAAVWIETTNQGEFTTASNVGVGGVGLYKQKTGADLEFRSVNAGSSKLSVTLDAGNNEIDLDVIPGNIAHGDLADVGSNTHAQIDTHLGSTSNPHSVTKSQVGLGEVANLKVKLDATGAPTVNNDTSEGYTVGSRWMDITGDKEYVCLDNTDGAAVWIETTVGDTGEVNTVSNVGVGGVGVFKQKTGVDLEFRSVNAAAANRVSVTLDAGNNEIDLDVVPGNIAHGDLADVGSNTHAQIDTHLGSSANPHSVTKSQVGLGEVANLKVNLVATVAPTVNNDTSEGYSVGSRWVDVTGDKEYVCLDNTDGAAVWSETTNQGEVNTASNVGVGGVAVFKQKSGVDLEFRSVNAGSSKLSVTLDAGNNEIDLDVVPGNIAHGDLTDVGSNTHAQIDTHLASTSNPHSVTKTQVGLSEVPNLKMKLNATIAPTVNNDTSEGYAVGSIWVDVSGDKAYICLDETDGAAVWKETTISESSGEANTASNVGVGGVGVFKQKTAADLEFRTVNAGSNKLTVTLDAGNNEIDLDVVPGNIAHGDLVDVGSNTHAQIDSHLASTSNPHSVTKSQVGLGEVPNLKVKLNATSAPTINNDTSEGYSVGSRWIDIVADKEYTCLDNTDGAAVWKDVTITSVGEINTASNEGVGGVGVFKQKTGANLEFKSVAAGSSKVTVTDDTGNNEIDIDVVPGNIAHQDLSGAGTNTHAQIDTHIANAALHRTINDAGTATTDLWSANKIDASLDLRIPYSETNLINIENGSPGGGNHVQFLITKSHSGADDYNLGIDSDPVKVIFSAEDGTYRQATVFSADVATSGATIFGVSSSMNSGSSWTPRFVICQNGNVGVGKSNPAEILDVVGNIALSGTVDGRDVAADGTTLDNHVGSSSNPHSVTKSQVGLSEVPNLKVNLVATVAPTVNNDTSEGYGVGSRWIDVTGNKEYVCLDETDGAAVWTETTSTGGSGEVNTASNVGSGGVAVYKQKTGVDLEFRSVNAASNMLSVTLDGANNEIDLDVNPANIGHDELADTGTNTHAQIDTHLASTSNPHSVTKSQVGLSEVANLKVNLSATGAPTVNNDTSEGYGVGSRWIDVSADKEYVCLDNTDGAAVWTETTGGGGGGGDVNGPGSSTDHAIVRFDGTGGKTIQNSGVVIDDTNHLLMVAGSVSAPALTFTGDTNTGIYSPGANQIAMATAGVQAMTINAAGEMGLGGAPTTDYRMTVYNPSGKNGFHVKAGEVLGDIAFHISDQDDTFQIMEMEADQGYVTMGKTYAQTLTDNGVVYGLDIQHSGNASDFNTQNGVYRVAGDPLAINHLDDVTISSPATDQVLKYNGSAWVNSAEGVASTLACVQARRTTTLILTATYADINLDVTDEETNAAVVEHNNTNTDRIDIKENGTYMITYCGNVSAGAAVATMNARVRKNDTTVINGSTTTVDELEADPQTSDYHLGKTFIATLATNDYLTLQVNSDPAQVDTTLMAGMVVTVVKLEGVKGDDGAPGAGSTVICKDEGTNVANTPHSALDFVGTGVTVTDGGSGVATVTINAGGGSTSRRFDAYYNPGTETTVSTTWVDVPLTTNRYIDADFTHSGGSAEVTINTTDTYMVIARCSTYIVSSSTRTQSQMRLVLDTGGGYNQITGSLGYMYNRETTEGYKHSHCFLDPDLQCG